MKWKSLCVREEKIRSMKVRRRQRPKEWLDELSSMVLCDLLYIVSPPFIIIQ